MIFGWNDAFNIFCSDAIFKMSLRFFHRVTRRHFSPEGRGANQLHTPVGRKNGEKALKKEEEPAFFFFSLSRVREQEREARELLFLDRQRKVSKRKSLPKKVRRQKFLAFSPFTKECGPRECVRDKYWVLWILFEVCQEKRFVDFVKPGRCCPLSFRQRNIAPDPGRFFPPLLLWDIGGGLRLPSFVSLKKGFWRPWRIIKKKDWNRTLRT